MEVAVGVAENDAGEVAAVKIGDGGGAFDRFVKVDGRSRQRLAGGVEHVDHPGGADGYDLCFAVVIDVRDHWAGLHLTAHGPLKMDGPVVVVGKHMS